MKRKPCYIAGQCEDFRTSGEADITRLAKSCQSFSLQGAKPTKDVAFAARLREAFQGAKDAEIARKLGYRSQSPITKFMSGVYPGPEVLIEISRVTKRSVHWLLTGEGEADLDPYAFVEPGNRRIAQKIADASNRDLSEVVNALLREGIRRRIAEMVINEDALHGPEIDQLRSMVENLLSGDEVDEEASASASSRRRRA